MCALRLISAFCLLVGSLNNELIAGPGSVQSVRVLTESADAVVVANAEVKGIGGELEVTLWPERILKGASNVGSSITFQWTQPQRPIAGVRAWSAKGHGVFFLKLTSTKTWSLLPATGGDVTWENTFLGTPSTISQATREVASVGLPEPLSPLDRVLLEVVVAIESGAPAPVDLLWAFRESNSPVLGKAFSRFLAKADKRLRIVGLRGAVIGSDPGIIGVIHQDRAALAADGAWRLLVDDIKYHYVNASPEAVQSLGQVAVDQKEPMDLRIAAAAALARVHTRQTLPYLARLLDAEDMWLKTAAVGGMASFANNVPIGSHQPASGSWPYRTEETILHSTFDHGAIVNRGAYFVGFWKSWWHEHQGKLGP